MKKFSYQKTIDVYNTLGRKYFSDSLKVIPAERESFSKLILPKAHILDAGCGGGRDAKYFVHKDFAVTGIDASKVFISIAKKEVPKATFNKMDVLKLNFPSQSFDAIWAEAVLLHLKRKDIPKALKSFYKILKPNGYLYVNVKKGKGEAQVKEKLSGGHERFYTYFSKKEIIDLLKTQGFKIIYYGIFPDPHGRSDVKWISIWGQK